MKYTGNTLKKIELILEEIGYKIRYEKGNFQAGVCVVHAQKMLIINKFYDTEARITSLVEIIKTMEIDPAILSENSNEWYKKIRAKS